MSSVYQIIKSVTKFILKILIQTICPCIEKVCRFLLQISSRFTQKKLHILTEQELIDEVLVIGQLLFPIQKKYQLECFKRFVNIFEIEVFSFCNRTCSFCPNSYIDRRSENHFMDENLYMKVMSELAEIDYEGIVWYSRYNEPLADRIILKRIQQTRQLLPKAKLQTYTNGDYVTREYLDDLADAGLNEIRIMRYPDAKDTKTTSEKMSKMIEKLGLPIIHKNSNCIELNHSKLHVQIYSFDIDKNVTNRAGSLTINPQNYKRFAPCYSPFSCFHVDYNGSVFPCCHARSDIESHRSLILGNIENETIFDIFFGEKAQMLRRLLKNNKIHFSPCNECDNYLYQFPTLAVSKTLNKTG
jgi:radical SAM protein with 4Fe4S-binding SPASM domain